MPRFKILTKEEIKEFDQPIEFSQKEKEKYFAIDHLNSDLIEKTKNFDNKVAFILMSGYFKAHKKFILPNRFYKSDIKFVVNLLSGAEETKVDLSCYSENTLWRHKKIIASMFGFKLFSSADTKELVGHIMPEIEKQQRPRKILSSLLEILDKEKIEIPMYHSLYKVIVIAFTRHEEITVSKLESFFNKSSNSYEIVSELNSLIESCEEEVSSDKNTQGLKKISSDFQKYQITLLKKPNYSTKPGKIKEALEDLEDIKELYEKISDIMEEISLPESAIIHYATWVAKARVGQLTQFKNKYKRYLYLISFITHQYYFRQDLFMDFFLQSVQSCLNVIKTLEKSQYFDNKKGRNDAIRAACESSRSLKSIIDEIGKIMESNSLSNNEKVAKTQEIIASNMEQIYYQKDGDKGKSFDEIINRLEFEISPRIQDSNYYGLLSGRSIKLQNRVSGILKLLQFDPNSPNEKLFKAIDYYKAKDGSISKKAPTGFLSKEEREVISGPDKKVGFNVSLYKSLLFIKVASSIKSGNLALKSSYRYKAIDQYLIDKEVWNNNRDDLLRKAGLEKFVDSDAVLSDLSKKLDEAYCKTNQNILSDKNKHVKFDKNGKAIVSTPKLEKEDILSDSEAASIFPKDSFYPILQVLEDVNQATDFVGTFEHYNIKYAKPKPANEVFYGGIMGHGFDLGSERIVKISKGISSSTLSNTINWYFTLDNLYSANNILNKYIHKLSLSDLFQKDPEKLHTSSDGQKFDLSLDSIDSNYSFKYHGKEKGISVYSFVDEKNSLFYSTAFSSSEREAAYVLDGLLHNDEVTSDIHSTDTHGYTETIFAATHLSEILFAPRIKNLKKQKLYSFKNKKIKHYQDKNYKILPSEYIDEKIIEDNWDDILRLMATIKLKYSSASQIFKRLSSYAKQNPLYKALKEFGRIIKSLFILQYYDDVELRQSIEKQLNLVELSHKFAKAIFFGNNQEFNAQSKEEQEIIVNCRRLIQNAIVLWNYLYISDLLVKEKDIKKQKATLQMVQNKSMMWWRHMNFYGEYDFTIVAKIIHSFDMAGILQLDVGEVLRTAS